MNEFLPMPVVPTNSASACDEKGEYNRGIAYFDEVNRAVRHNILQFRARVLATWQGGSEAKQVCFSGVGARLAAMRIVSKTRGA